MENKAKIYVGQLKETCKIANARWAVWVERVSTDWNFYYEYGLNKTRLEVLRDFVNTPQLCTRIVGGLATGRTRYYQTGSNAEVLGCDYIYLFPVPDTQLVLIVGADQLEKEMRGFFRVLAQAGVQPPSDELSVDQFLSNFLRDFDTGISYDLESALHRVLQIISRYISNDVTCIGLRYGDSLRLEAVWPKEKQFSSLQIPTNRTILSKVVSDRAALIVDDIQKDGPCPLLPQICSESGSWMGIPLWIGRRVIGVVCFVSKESNAYHQDSADRARIVAAHVAPAIETSMALAEASLHLEKLALLNELASAASIGIDAAEVASRIILRLKRIFETELVAILLLSSNGKMLQEFGDSYSGDTPLIIPVESSLSGYVVETGLPVRVGDVSKAPRYFDLTPGVCSELTVPLKYRGDVIGVLDLESKEPDAFSLRDEQLLVVMASQLAGLIENVRLHDETRQRARNLDLIHQVIQDVVGLTEIPQIAQVAAELMAERFAFELALVILVDDRGEYLTVEGIGGNVSEQITLGMKRPIEVGIAGRVCHDGVSRLVNDTSNDKVYDRLPGWPGGSEMCVALWDGDLIFGVLVVERSRKDAFTENDLIVLESLAGVLSSVMINARSYQQLSTNLRHFRAVRETALDISADLDLDTLLRRVTLRVRELVGAKGAELGLVNEENQTVEIKVSENPWESYSKGLVIPFNHGIAGIMAVKGETLAVDDYASWAGGLRLGNPPPFTAVAGVPLKYKGRVIGTLTISHDEPNRGFDPADVRLLELLAPQVAVSVRNARLYQELQTLMEAERLAKDHLIRSARLAAVGELAAGVAHELNNPLTTVAGFVELVLDDLPVDSPHRPDLELVLKEARRAREVVRRLLDFSRPGEGFRVNADVNDLVSDVIALVHHLLHTSGVEIKTEMQEDLPWIQVDRDQIKQVLLNLVHNAIHAMPRGGTLTMQTETWMRDEDPGVIIRVRDTGQGISPEHLDRLFEPFFTTRPPGKGTGLGLSVSYGIITDHGGLIDVESAPGLGSTFTVWLPIQSNKIFI
ncbi:MAG: GAF domain-containing protein [Anaerolineales bacterium]